MSAVITNVIGSISPMQATRLRVVANTYSKVLLTISAGAKLDIDQVVLYTSADPAQPATWAGDLWGRVTKINEIPIALLKDDKGQPIEIAYMAIRYHNEPICKPQYITSDTTEPQTPADPNGVKEITGSTITYTSNDGKTHTVDLFPKQT